MNHSARVLFCLLLASAVTAQSKNLLFYGNSFMSYSWGYGAPELVQLIAIEAGHPSPTIVTSLVGGGTLPFYASDPTQVARISNGLPSGQTWDAVVMQGHMLEATNGGGFNAALFRAGAVAIMTNVRNHSPVASAVMYQTWATAWGQMYYGYPGPWPVPMALHNEIRGNYRLAVSDINATFGAGAAANSAVGDGVALLEWNPAWYEPDLFHPNPAMVLLAAMCLYTTIYGQTVCEIDPSFNPAGPVALALAPFGIGQATWNQLAGIADSCADRAVRRYPGSGDHLLLETGTGPGQMTACHENRMTVGTLVQMQMRSMNGVYAGAAGWLLVDTFTTGFPPGPSVIYPEIQVGALSILSTTATLANPLSFSIQMPFSWPGTSVLVQGLAWQPSMESGNSWFTTTNAHEFVFF